MLLHCMDLYYMNKGSSHWIHQRVSAILLLISLIFCGVSYFLKYDASLSNMGYFAILCCESIFFTTFAIIGLTSALYHGNIGMNVIIEDYISKSNARLYAKLIISCITIITSVIAFVVLIRFHIMTTVY
jgi:succinate dehydrogenase hydrophobic membrane anchor protein